MDFALINSKFGKVACVITAISFSWLAVFGLLHHMSEMKPAGAMGSSCLFNGQVEVCAMNFSEHIALWQGMLVSLPQYAGLFLLMAVAMLAAVTVFGKKYFAEFAQLAASRRSYTEKHPRIYLFNALIETFARGILNPKIFAPAAI